jgi:hypothetical protein
MSLIYLAGGSCEVDMVSSYMRAAESRGWRISFDWTKPVIEARRRGQMTDAMLSDGDRAAHAYADMGGVRAASVFWLLVPPPSKSAGAWFEFGAACMRRDYMRSIQMSYEPIVIPLRVIVSGLFHRNSIFSTLACERYANHDLALEALGVAT